MDGERRTGLSGGLGQLVLLGEGLWITGADALTEKGASEDDHQFRESSSIPLSIYRNIWRNLAVRNNKL
jgi:hypothetical protein